MKKLTPDDHRRIDRLLEQNHEARRNMQAILDRVAARRLARRRKSRGLQRLLFRDR